MVDSKIVCDRPFNCLRCIVLYMSFSDCTIVDFIFINDILLVSVYYWTAKKNYFLSPARMHLKECLKKHKQILNVFMDLDKSYFINYTYLPQKRILFCTILIRVNNMNI